MSEFEDNITRTLLYYEIFDHPLSMKELFLLSPAPFSNVSEFKADLDLLVDLNRLVRTNGFYLRPASSQPMATIRREREDLATRRMYLARLVAFVIRRFPFVSAVFLSGDLSKGVAAPDSDVDYVIVTAPGRLWICRLTLILFKKVFLFNSRKYFCLNYFLSEDRLELDDRNYYTASEIAHLKPLVNFPLFLRYLNANGWIKEYFPNYSPHELTHERPHRKSLLQALFELPFHGAWADKLDERIMHRMRKYWLNKYPQFASATHDKIFKCTRSESRAYVGNFEGRILDRYHAKLKEHGLTQPSKPHTPR